MTPRRLFTILSVTAALLLLIAACGDDDDDPTATSPAAGGAPTETRDTGDQEDPLVARGQALYTEQGCNACHSTDGSASIGPTWQGLYGHEVELEDGSTVTADEEYLRESITDPNAKVVAGFQPIMPAFPNLSDDDIDALIAFIQSLS